MLTLLTMTQQLEHRKVREELFNLLTNTFQELDDIIFTIGNSIGHQLLVSLTHQSVILASSHLFDGTLHIT